MNMRALILLCFSLISVCAGTAHAEPAPSLVAPASAPAGSTLLVKWVGPGASLDRIAALPAGSPDATFPKGLPCYPQGHNPAPVVLPEEPGEYELRYFSGKTVVARRKLTVLRVTATLDAPKTATGGATILVRWTGPNNQFDVVGIVPAGAAEHRAPGGGPHFTSLGSPLKVPAPEQPGEYEIRYITGRGGSTLARARLTVTGASASLSGPASVVAGSNFKVTWKGPAGEFDRITVAVRGEPDRKSVGGDFTSKGSPLGLKAPLTAGTYELRYVTSASGSILARAPLEVSPATLEPGTIRVTATAKGMGPGGGAVEIILDASGSMLQRLGGEPRFDIAKRTLAKLSSEIIPKGTPFALRMFGRGNDTCQSVLELPLAPLDPSAASVKFAALEAKSNGRTGIGAALEQVASDLAKVQGDRVVILVTDGEETCGGNPARAIQKLAKSGVNVRVNIVGFAVDNEKLATTFELWSKAGSGSYFDARDAQALSDAFSLAVRPAFQVTDAEKRVVAEGLIGGDSVKVMPGTYSVKLKGAKSETRSVTVRARETSNVSF